MVGWREGAWGRRAEGGARGHSQALKGGACPAPFAARPAGTGILPVHTAGPVIPLLCSRKAGWRGGEGSQQGSPHPGSCPRGPRCPSVGWSLPAAPRKRMTRPSPRPSLRSRREAERLGGGAALRPPADVQPEPPGGGGLTSPHPTDRTLLCSLTSIQKEWGCAGGERRADGGA